MKNIWIIILIMWMGGCYSSENQVAGGEDFPNSVSADIDLIGNTIIAAAEDSSSWNSFESVDLNTEITSEEGALAKTSGIKDFDSLFWNLSDSANGKIQLIQKLNRPRYFQMDTLIFKSNSIISDSLKMTELLSSLKGKKEFRFSNLSHQYQYIDCDGDSLLLRFKNSQDRVCVVWATQHSLMYDTVKMTVSPGIDGDFKSDSDNWVYQWDRHWQKNNVCTSTTFINQDSDSVLLHRNKLFKDTVLLNVMIRKQNVKSQKMLVVYSEKDVIDILEWSEKDSLKKGEIRESKITKSENEGLFNRDTLVIEESWTRPSHDTIASENGVVKVLSRGILKNPEMWGVIYMKKTLVFRGTKKGRLSWEVISEKPFNRSEGLKKGYIEFQWKPDSGDSLLFKGEYTVNHGLNGVLFYSGNKSKTLEIKKK